MAAIFEEFANGDAFNASDANTYYMRQVTITCDNQTDRDSILTPAQGLTVYRKDTKAIERYNGSSWDAFDTIWQSYTPTLTNFTIGNGTLTCKYFRQGKKITVRFFVRFGSTTGMGTDPTVSLPVTAEALVATANIMQEGHFSAFDSSANSYYYGSFAASSTTTKTLRIWATNGTFASPQVMGAATPMTWAVNDEIAGEFIYDAA